MNPIFCVQVILALITTEAAKLNRLTTELNQENVINLKPFHPFNTVGAAAVPIIRPDNTTKSRVPEDTLLREGPQEFEVGFDSLDNHLQDNAISNIRQKVSVSDVGNLHPDEVFYVDNDLLIIKGGGLRGPQYTEPERSLENEEEFHFNEISSRPPNPHEEYNGNVATIVMPPPDHPKFAHRPKPAFYPGLSPLALFLPARMLSLPNEPHYYYVPVQYEVIAVPPSYLWVLLNHGNPFYQPPKPALSFIGDTNVNFVNPRPQINPDAESISIPFQSTNPQTQHSHRRRVKPRL